MIAYCLALLDVLFAVSSVYFFFTELYSNDCYSAECPQQIKTWLIGSCFNFYLLQASIATIFLLKDRRLSLLAFITATLLYLPSMLAWNIWGNLLIEKIEEN